MMIKMYSKWLENTFWTQIYFWTHKHIFDAKHVGPFWLISFQTHQEFKWFSSRKRVKNCNFFEKIENFHEYRWFHHSGVGNRKPMSCRTFLDHEIFWIWKNFKIDFLNFMLFFFKDLKNRKKMSKLVFRRNF